ncbi:MAG: heme/steroid binding protein [Herbinix sp.]|jgi:predicted heme/steroid binding protein|nr:heme/steroid binding protein [Herbinix sp.]
MDEFEMRRRIYGYIKEICHYSQMQVFATSYYQKNYFQMQIDDATSALISLYTDLWKPPDRQRRNRRDTDRENDIINYQKLSFGMEGRTIDNPPDGQQISPEGQQAPPEVQQAPPEVQQNPQQELIEFQPEQVPQPETRIFTIEELANYNGKEGRPSYVAVNGIVYDVSALVRWAGGTHFGMVAGRDLSGPFMSCHQGIMDRLNKAPKVGILE